MAEDKLRNHDLVFGMDHHRNAFAVIPDGKGCGCDGNPELGDLPSTDSFGRRARDVVDSIHDNFVEDLVKPRIEVDGAPDHLAGGRIVDPAALFVRVTGTDVGIG